MSAKQMNKMTLYVIPIAIALNIVVSNIVFALKLPIWLDSIGVVLTAVISGFWPATIVGVITGLASLITNPSNIFPLQRLFDIPAFITLGNYWRNYYRRIGITYHDHRVPRFVLNRNRHHCWPLASDWCSKLVGSNECRRFRRYHRQSHHSSCRFLHFDCLATAHTCEVPQWREIPPLSSKGYKVSIQTPTK